MVDSITADTEEAKNLSEDVKRALNGMDKWSPAIVNDKAVESKLYLELIFN